MSGLAPSPIKNLITFSTAGNNPGNILSIVTINKPLNVDESALSTIDDPLPIGGMESDIFLKSLNLIFCDGSPNHLKLLNKFDSHRTGNSGESPTITLAFGSIVYNMMWDML